MSGKWTPGPWEYRKSDIASGVVVAPGDAVIDCEQTICTICDCSDYDEVSGADAIILDDRAEANARLIAAAPDLVEALEFYANPNVYEPHAHGLAFERRDLSYVARTALAKAKGEAA